MKKLLVAAIGAATAFGAFAEYTNAQRFEGMERGETIVSALGSNWSEKPNSTNTYTIVEMEAVGETINHPDAFANATDPENALYVKTTFGKPLSYNVVSGGTATNLESNLFFDSLVKFTVCDSTPDQTYDGAKIIMWLQTNEAETQTNLYVRAGYLGDGIVTTNDYICGNTIGGDFADKWHRVTIKAMPTISTASAIPGFAIFIDGGANTMEVSSDVAKWATAPALTEAAAHYGQTKIFPSIIQDSEDSTKLTLTCASFDGTGTLNDMVFTSKTPAFTEAEDYVEDRATVVDENDQPISGSPFKSLADAVAAVNGLSSGTYTFTLSKSEVLDGTLNFNSSANIIFDFAGCVLTNAAAYCAITNTTGAITFTDSGTGGGITCTDPAAGAIYVSGATGTGATIAGGIFRSTEVAVQWALLQTTKIHITGGSFAVTTTALENSAKSEGKKFQLNGTTGLYDVVNFEPVAQIEGGDQYETLKAAVDEAQAGDTVTVLADCAVDASVSFTKNITVSNDYTIAANVNYALCIGATVTFEGSGKIQRKSGITGSAFCVGANETTRGAITEGTAGALIFNSGTVCGGSGGNQIKLENGTVTMNGGVLKDGKRGIKADADAGSYTSAIVINGGTITNCEIAVMASAESATGTATLTVNGGDFFGNFESSVSNGTATITINGGNITGTLTKKTATAGTGTATLTIPGTSTAKFNADQTAFCETGYETVLNDGWYEVQKKSDDPIPPLPAEPTAADVTNAIEQAKFVDAAAVKAIVGGDPVKYAAFKAWAGTVTGGETAVVAGPHAAVSYQLSPIVASATLFANEPTLTFTEIAPAASGSNWEVTVELKDGETAVQLKAAVADFASRVWKGGSLSTMTQCTASDVTVATQVGGTKVKLTVTPPAGNSGFIKIKAE